MQINDAYPVQANFEIQNEGDARLTFGPKGSLIVKAFVCKPFANR